MVSPELLYRYCKAHVDLYAIDESNSYQTINFSSYNKVDGSILVKVVIGTARFSVEFEIRLLVKLEVFYFYFLIEHLNAKRVAVNIFNYNKIAGFPSRGSMLKPVLQISRISTMICDIMHVIKKYDRDEAVEPLVLRFTSKPFPLSPHIDHIFIEGVLNRVDLV